MRQLSRFASVALTSRSYTVLPELKKPAGAPATLPKLDFDGSNGCPPVLSPRQLELHHTKHHQAYVTKFNALAGDSFDGKTFEEIMTSTHGDASQKVLFNQAAQHFNHSFYWKCLAPNGTPMPAELEKALTEAFGGVDKFRAAFEAQGMSNFGSGWTWLVYNPATKALEITNTSNAGCPTVSGLRPLFTADVWEHAYYKDFEFRRADYLSELWKIANWNFVASQLSRAKASA